jgi:MFS family permease
MLFSFADLFGSQKLFSEWIDVDREFYFSSAVILIGFGGPGVQNAIIHFSNLFPTQKGLVTAIITGCFQLSFVVFFIIDQLWFFGNIGYQDLFFGHGFLCFLCLITSLLFWPDEPYHFDLPQVTLPESPLQSSDSSPEVSPSTTPTRKQKKKFQGVSRVLYPRSESNDEFPSPRTYDRQKKTDSSFSLVRYPSFFQHDSDDDMSQKNSRAMSVDTDCSEFDCIDYDNMPGYDSILPPPPLPPSPPTPPPPISVLPAPPCLDIIRPKNKAIMVQLGSMQFFCATSLLSISSFWANFYIGAVDLQLSAEDYMSPHDQAACMRWFTIITTAGVLGVPVVGSCIDKLGFRKTLIITLSLGCLWAACTLISHRYVLLFSFGVYSLFRTFLFNYFFTFVADRLGFRFFGILAGISFFIAALCGLLQAPLLTYIQSPCTEFGDSTVSCMETRWKLINAVKLVSIASLFGFTWLPSHRRRKNHNIKNTGSYELVNQGKNHDTTMLESVVLESR